MITRTKEDVERYLFTAKRYVFASALKYKNTIKGIPESETLGYLTKKLAEEVGEVAEALIERDYDAAIDEIGDALWTAVMLAVRIEVEHAEHKKDYPSGY